MTSCYGSYTVVGLNIKREMVLSPDDEVVANSSKKPTQFKNEKSKNYCKADLRQRVLFFITIFRLAIPAFFRFTDVTELM